MKPFLRRTAMVAVLSVEVSMATLLPAIPVFGLSAQQYRVSHSGAEYFNVGEDDAACGGPTSGDTNLVGNTNFQKIFNFFVQNKFTPEQSAGIIGNISKEDPSGDPQVAEGGKKLPYPPDPDNKDKGYGIAQFSPARKLINYAESVNQPVNSLSTQLNFMLAQLTGEWKQNNEQTAGDELKTTTTVDDAAAAFLGTKQIQSGPYAGKYYGYERPQDEGANLVPRIASARSALETYGSGAPTPNDGSLSTPAVDSSTCSCKASGASAQGAGTTTVVLDPGHSPRLSQPSIDAATNIVTTDYENDPEMQQMYDASVVIATKLKADGYTVINTKKSVNDYVDLKQRADIANQAQAVLGISLHTSAGSPATQNNIFYPKVGEFRYTSDGKKSEPYSDQALSDKDKAYSETMATVRQDVEGQPVRSGSYIELIGSMRSIKDSPPLMQKGSVLTTQYFAKTPWVYNEKSQDSAANGLTAANLQKYEDGIVAGVEKILPKPATTPTGDCTSAAVVGNAVQTAINYAWPDYHAGPYLKFKDSYRAAIDKAIANREYVGGNENPGVDCGGFITRVMRDSGADPKYNSKEGATPAQQAYMDAHPEKYQNLGPQTNSANLQPGDIAINSQHTFMWVGKQPNFNGNSVSSSIALTNPNSWRTPMATPASWSNEAGPYTWYRLKT